MITHGKSLDRRIVAYLACALVALLLASPPSMAQICEREAPDPCCLHLTGQVVPCIENCNGGVCCWDADMSIMTVVADDVLYATGQTQIQYLVWVGRCRYKAPNCSTGTCTHPGPLIYRNCIIAAPNPDNCP